MHSCMVNNTLRFGGSGGCLLFECYFRTCRHEKAVSEMATFQRLTDFVVCLSSCCGERVMTSHYAKINSAIYVH
jgi:hypothetical protein